jgi:hypothetical protein
MYRMVGMWRMDWVVGMLGVGRTFVARFRHGS